MLESYHEEIAKKKRSARIFWCIVFIFASFLYFFFQGYYPVIQFQSIESVSGALQKEEPRVLIRSFGIINIRALPDTMPLFLNRLPYGNNEKKMVDYGAYSFIASGEGYLPAEVDIHIDNEKPFYIDLLTLISKPHYTTFRTPVDQVARIGTDAWIIGNASGMILYEKNFSTGTGISKTQITHIGDEYFLSGNLVVTYDQKDGIWKNTTNDKWLPLSKSCKKVTVVKGVLLCPSTHEGVLPNGKTITGILDIQSTYIRTPTMIFTLDGKKIPTLSSLSGSIFSEKIPLYFIDLDWYVAKEGEFISITGNKKSLQTSFSTIMHGEWIDNELLVFGKKDNNTFLLMMDPRFPDKNRIIPFPDIPLTSLRIWKTDGNIFIKTSGHIFMIYHGSHKTHWLIEGTILSSGNTSALYETGGKIWTATWSK